MSKLTEAQIRAQKNYNAKNREQRAYWRDRSAARGFIKNKATIEDLKEMEKMNMNIHELLTSSNFESKTFGAVYIDGQPYDHEDLLEIFGTDRDYIDPWDVADDIFKDINHRSYPTDYGYAKEDDNLLAQDIAMEEDFRALYALMVTQVNSFSITAGGDMVITTINGGEV